MADAEELTEEELEELKAAAALKASSDLLAAAKANDEGVALNCLDLATTVHKTEHGSYWSSLHYAALHGNARLLNGLISRGAHEKYVGEMEKRKKRLRQLDGAHHLKAPSAGFDFEEDEDVSVFMNTPLHWSCYKGHMATTLTLLDAGYSLEDVDSVGNTPLHLAAASQVVPVVELLISSGADPVAKNRYHLSPLDVAVSPAVRSVLVRALKQVLGEGKSGQLPKASSAQAFELRGHREDMRKNQSAALRDVAAKISEVISRPAPQSRDEEGVRIVELQAAKTAAEGTNGVVDGETIATAGRLIERFTLGMALRLHLSETQKQHPVVSQRAYTGFVNKLERYVKAGERQGVESGVLEECRKEIACSFAEYWLFKVEDEIKGVECAIKELEPRINLLEERIKKATALGGSESLITSSTKLLERLRSEIALAHEVDTIPPYKLPPAEEDTAELNKKQLQVFLDSYWGVDDVGHIKETTEEEGCHPFPLPPGFAKDEEDEVWNANPLKALINTPEGYIWVPSKALVYLRTKARDLDVAVIRSTNAGAFSELIDSSKERLQQIEQDIQHLELKDETDMTLAEAKAAKESKKMRAALSKKAGKKK